MTDPRTLPAPYDRVVAVLELAAAASGGHVAYATTVRARKTGDLLDIDAAVYLPGSSGENICPVTFASGDEPVGVELVDASAAHRRATDGRGSAIVSTSGFTRPARKRAGDEGVALVTPGKSESTGWPSWLGNAAFESQNMQWRVRNIGLPPVPGLPKNLLEGKYSPRDEIFANPQGRHFTAEELLGRWMKAPQNERAFREQLPRDGKRVTRNITLRFDRPMRVLANTVRPIPPVLWSDFAVEAWMEIARIPLSLVESPLRELPGAPPVAFVSASAPGPGGAGTVRLWLWLEQPEGDGEPRVRAEMLSEEPAEAPPEPAEG